MKFSDLSLTCTLLYLYLANTQGCDNEPGDVDDRGMKFEGYLSPLTVRRAVYGLSLVIVVVIAIVVLLSRQSSGPSAYDCSYMFPGYHPSTNYAVSKLMRGKNQDEIDEMIIITDMYIYFFFTACSTSNCIDVSASTSETILTVTCVVLS